MKIILIFSTFSIFFINFSSTLTLDCLYSDHSAEYGYRCQVLNKEFITSKEDREITEVQGDHEEGKNNEDVNWFMAFYKKIHFFPRGVTKFFKNIERVEINAADLKEITKDDLKQFGDNLKELWLVDNEIEVIRADLFENNKNLRLISFFNNKINQIDVGAFNGLQSLKSLHLNSNLCTTFENSAYGDREKVLKLIKNVEMKCKI